jgi:hypothetical protein
LHIHLQHGDGVCDHELATYGELENVYDDELEQHGFERYSYGDEEETYDELETYGH